jgi:hypothetical protein
MAKRRPPDSKPAALRLHGSLNRHPERVQARPFILALAFGLGASFMLSAPICAA